MLKAWLKYKIEGETASLPVLLAKLTGQPTYSSVQAISLLPQLIAHNCVIQARRNIQQSSDYVAFGYLKSVLSDVPWRNAPPSSLPGTF
jgi:hypothetical protein